MNSFQRISILLLRVGLGGLYLYAGLSKLINPAWSAVGYLNSAQTLPGFYAWLTRPEALPIVNFVNEWALFLLGVSLILGLCVRLSTIGGIALMVLYYLPILHFPYVGKTSFLIDEHVIFILALLLLNAWRAGRVIGLDKWCSKSRWCSKLPL